MPHVSPVGHPRRAAQAGPAAGPVPAVVARRGGLGRMAELAWVPLPVSLVLIGGLWLADVRGIYLSAPLLFAMTLSFGAISAGVVALLAGRSFFATGAPNVLFLGTGAIIWGLSGPASTIVPGISINATMTIHNIGCWLAGMTYLGGLVTTGAQSRRLTNRPVWLLGAYLAAVVAVTVLVILATRELTPLFFVQGKGGTLVRHVVLGSAALMFAAAGALLLRTSRSAAGPFATWYGHGLLLIATGLFGLVIQREFGSLLSWVSRATQWLGGVYMVVAAVLVARASPTFSITLAAVAENARLRYAMAVAFVVAAIAARLVFLAGIDTGATYVTFFPAVILAALYGGTGPGLVAALLSTVLVSFWWDAPHWIFDVQRMLGHSEAGLFLIGASAVAVAIGSMQAARSRAALAESKLAVAGELEAAAEALRASEQRALQALREAEAASRAKDDFVAMLSHELRTPLTPALLNAGALRDDERLPADARAQLDIVHRNVALEARLIDDLLDVSRAGRGKLVLQREHCDLHRLLERTLEIVEGDVREKQLRIVLDLAAARHWAHGDPVRLQQVFWNVLRNAVKFTPAGGEIQIATTNTPADGGTIHVLFRDSGPGLEPAELERIFRPFEQTMNDARSRFGGLGLGLAIARGVMLAHGGSIVAESAGRGCGATFTVTLQAIDAPVAGTGSGAAVDGGASGESAAALRILLVEDHEPTRETLQRLLARNGHEVVSGESMGAALRIAEAQTFDLLISDLGLPDGDGCELMRQLRLRRPLPGIALSGYGMESDIAASLAAGFSRHLVKPVDFELLREAMREVLGAQAGVRG